MRLGLYQRFFIITSFLFCLLPFAHTQNSCPTRFGDLIVTNADDEGVGSLRNAIECANAIEGPNTIRFSIMGSGRRTIYVGSTTGEPLPALTDAGTTIDGNTQTGPTNQPRIVLDGSRTNWTAPVNGLFIVGNACQLFGLEILNFPDDCIDVAGAENVVIGSPRNGNVIHSCGEATDYYEGITPAGPYEGNGIRLRDEARFCIIQGNVIGANAFLAAQPNEYSGILIQNGASNNVIGGYELLENNTIAHNLVGIRVENAVNCAFLGNNFTCNTEAGIQLENANNNKAAPIITASSETKITGTATPFDNVDVYFNGSENCESQACQGNYSATVPTDADGKWEFDMSDVSEFSTLDIVSVLATDAAGNTSPFSNCRSITEPETGCANTTGEIVVTNTNDDGEGSLRAAIACANQTSGRNRIIFDIPLNGPHIIYVGATTGQPLPPLEDNNTTIDATTQLGFGVLGETLPMIILDGARTNWNTPENGLVITGNEVEVYGLEIKRFPYNGILVDGANNGRIGASDRGNVIYDCGEVRDNYDNTENASFEGSGILLTGASKNFKISGNILGTNYIRNIAIGNEYCGIRIESRSNDHHIGGATADESNTIAYNPAGVLVAPSTNGIHLQRNSFICNDTIAIRLEGNANGNKLVPTIGSFSTTQIIGTAEAFDSIQLYVSNEGVCTEKVCQGQFYVGATVADAAGNWVLSAPFEDFKTLLGDESLTVLATDADGNTSEFSVCKKNEQDNCETFQASIEQSQEESCDNGNGFFTVSVGGGTPPYSYDIGNGASNNPTFENLSAGTYAVTITDANACETTQAFSISNLDPPIIEIIDATAATCDQANGSFTIVAYGGISPYTYSIGEAFGENYIFNNLLPGSYEIQVADATGCVATQTVEVQNQQSLSMDLTQAEAAFCEEDNGLLIVAATGGTQPIVYDIGLGEQSTPIFEDLAAGVYTITATDANGCQIAETYEVTEIPPLVLEITEIIDANCDFTGGGFKVSTTGGAAPIVFDYGNGLSADSSYTNLNAGTYLITATDAKGCVAIRSAQIGVSSDLEVNITNVQEATCGLDNGTFFVEVAGGTAPFSYDIGNGSTEEALFDNLSEGNYTLTITDGGGCELTETIYITAAQPLFFNVINVQAANCEGEGGALTILPSGGTLPISYTLDDVTTSNPFFGDLTPGIYTLSATDAVGCTFEQEVIIELTGELKIETIIVEDATCGEANGQVSINMTSGFPPYQYYLNDTPYANATLENLPAGTYNLLVEDRFGCRGEQSIVIGDSEPLKIQLAEQTEASCGTANGGFNVIVENGIEPYTYDIGAGATENNKFEGIKGGVYNLTVTDALGCSNVLNIFLDETEAVSISIINRKDATCTADNGTFKVRPETGTEPYRYDIGNGFTFDPVFADLAPGTYILTVEDGNGCSSTEQVEIARSEIQLQANIENKQDASCGLENGSFRVMVTNGIAPFTFDYGVGPVNNAVFSDIPPGDYTISITDAVGCYIEQEVSIAEATGGFTFEIEDKTIATCGQSNGSFTVNVTQGEGPFTYDIGEGTTNDPILDQLGEGLYELTVTDANGCQQVEEVLVEETIPLTIDIINVTNDFCLDGIGAFEVVVNSGTPPYSYDMGEGVVTNPIFTDIMGGFYTLSVTDANFCMITQTVTIDQNPPLQSRIISQSTTSCGEANGAIALEASGGSRPYTFDIGTGSSTSSFFRDLAAGNYVITITDNVGCTRTQAVEIANSTNVSATTARVEPATCGEANGVVEVTAIGGQAPYTYDIGEGAATSPVFENLAAGEYDITVVDVLGCETNLTINIESSSDLTATITDKQDDFCGNGDGTFTIQANGGQAPYGYDIGAGFTSNGTFSNLAPGEYNITTTDVSGCTTVNSITIIKGTDLNLALLSQRRPTCGADNGLAMVSASGGTAPYRFNLGGGFSANSSFADLSVGNYSITVLDANGCEASLDFNLPAESAPPTVSVINQTDVSCRQANGSISLMATEGLPPYTFNIGNGATTANSFDNLNAGNYEITVTDANGCEAYQTVTIGEVPNMSVTVGIMLDDRCDLGKGSLTMDVEGGTPPYRYDIGNGQQTSDVFDGLSAGSYTITVTDANDCTEEHTATLKNQPIFDLRIVNKSSASCGEANGAFTVRPFGGKEPYQYNIGNGNTNNERFENIASGTYTVSVTDRDGCRNEVEVVVEGSEAPTARIVIQNDATCGAANGTLIVGASGGISPYTFDIGEGASTSNDFNDLAEGTYDITVTDANGCSTILNARVNATAEIPNARFAMDSTGFFIELLDQSSNADSAVWDLGDGTIYTGTNVIHEYVEPGVYRICLTAMNACGTDEYCQEITITAASLKFANVLGTIYTEENAPIGDVTMICDTYDPATTDFEGTYRFENINRGDELTFTPEKNSNILNGITTFDIYLMNNHILTTELLDSPYKIIAADVNNSGSVTTFDVVTLRRLLLGLDTEFPEGNTSWRFIPADYNFPNPLNPFEETFPEAKSVTVDSTITNLDFIGVKIGDLNASAVLDGFNSTESRSTTQQFVTATTSRDEIILSIPKAIVGLQFTLHFDPDLIDTKKIELGDLPGLGTSNFNLEQIEAGRIALSWNQMGTDRTNNNVLLRLKLKQALRQPLSEVLQLGSDLITNEAYTLTNQLQIHPLELQFEQAEEGLTLHGNSPNPFRQHTNIHFDLTYQSAVALTLYDAKGSILQVQNYELQTGSHKLRIEGSTLPLGVIYYRLATDAEVVVGKMLVVE